MCCGPGPTGTYKFCPVSPLPPSSSAAAAAAPNGAPQQQQEQQQQQDAQLAALLADRGAMRRAVARLSEAPIWVAGPNA